MRVLFRMNTGLGDFRLFWVWVPVELEGFGVSSMVVGVGNYGLQHIPCRKSSSSSSDLSIYGDGIYDDVIVAIRKRHGKR